MSGLLLRRIWKPQRWFLGPEGCWSSENPSDWTLGAEAPPRWSSCRFWTHGRRQDWGSTTRRWAKPWESLRLETENTDLGPCARLAPWLASLCRVGRVSSWVQGWRYRAQDPPGEDTWGACRLFVTCPGRRGRGGRLPVSLDSPSSAGALPLMQKSSSKYFQLRRPRGLCHHNSCLPLRERHSHRHREGGCVSENHLRPGEVELLTIFTLGLL